MLYTLRILMAEGEPMAKDLYFAELYEQYKNLLNPHRRQLVYEYYILDLSLGEIAENGVYRIPIGEIVPNSNRYLYAQAKIDNREETVIYSPEFGKASSLRAVMKKR